MAIQLIVDWQWLPDHADRLRVRYVPQWMPPELTRLMSGESDHEVAAARSAETLANLIAATAKPLGAVDLPDGQVLEPEFSRVKMLGRSGIPQAMNVQLILGVQIPALGAQEQDHKLARVEAELSQTAKDLIAEIDQSATRLAYSDLFARVRGTGDKDQWVPSKVGAFISYRSTWEHRGLELFHALGQFEEQTVFAPSIDKVDMQAGNWIKQLEELITHAPNFIPILTTDYREGPVAREEFGLALRQTFGESSTKRVVPVLIEGSIEDYEDTFIGNYQIYDARGDAFSQEQIKDIASLLLGTSRNQYK